jgi:hypothetical protein
LPAVNGIHRLATTPFMQDGMRPEPGELADDGMHGLQLRVTSG